MTARRSCSSGRLRDRSAWTSRTRCRVDPSQPRAARGHMAELPLPDSDPTIGRLVSDATRDVSSLIRNEIQLAKTEVQLSVKAGGTGIALFAAAAFFAVMA